MTREAGLFLVDKPAGISSHEAVQEVRRASGIRRAGHTGTLDPFATGLLLVLVGRLTRAAEYFHELPKRYEAVLRLGVETDTDDVTGEPRRESDAWRALAPDRIRAAVEARIGESLQVPSAFSAKKVGGRRAYRAAREGRALDLAPVPIRVFEIEVLDIDPPNVRFRTSVSTGTYVRALGRDIGRELDCGGHLTVLRRTRIGPFDVEDAVPPDRWNAPGDAWREPAEALDWLPRYEADADAVEHVRHGRAIAVSGEISSLGTAGASPPPVAIVHEGVLAAIGTLEEGRLRPRKVFLP